MKIGFRNILLLGRKNILSFLVQKITIKIYLPGQLGCIQSGGCKFIVKLRQGSGKDRLGMAVEAKGLKACLELTIKLVATTTTTTTTHKSQYTSLMAWQLSGEAGGGKGRCVGSLWVTLGSL